MNDGTKEKGGRWSYPAALILLAAAAAVSAKLLHIDWMVNHFEGSYRSVCNISETFNCDAVAGSEYASLWGAPVALLGLLASLLLILYAGLAGRNPILRPHRRLALLGGLLPLSAGCLWFAYLSFTRLETLCLFCILFWLLVWTAAACAAAACGRQSLSVRNWQQMLAGLVRRPALPLALALVMLAGAGAFPALSLFGNGQDVWRSAGRAGIDPILGRVDAPVIVYQYTDFQCPWCRKSDESVLPLVEGFGDRIGFVRRDLPLDMECNPEITRPFHAEACRAARFARCAGRIGGDYWAVHGLLYAGQDRLGPGLYAEVCRRLSLDCEAVLACERGDGEVHRQIRADIDEGTRFGVMGTPTYRILGELFPGKISAGEIASYTDGFPRVAPEVAERIFKKGQQRRWTVFCEEPLKERFSGCICQCTLEGQGVLPGDERPVLVIGQTEEWARGVFAQVTEKHPSGAVWTVVRPAE